MGRDRVGASAAGPRVAASARLSCLGAGAGAQGAEASCKQKQQRSSQASAVFCRLSFLLLERVAVDADGERLSSSVLTAPILCCWRRLAASVAGPGALGVSGSRSSSELVDVVVRSSIFNVGISITQVENPRLTMVMSEIKTLMKR